MQLASPLLYNLSCMVDYSRVVIISGVSDTDPEIEGSLSSVFHTIVNITIEAGVWQVYIVGQACLVCKARAKHVQSTCKARAKHVQSTCMLLLGV